LIAENHSFISFLLGTELIRIDEYNIRVSPQILAKGTPLFKKQENHRLKKLFVGSMRQKAIAVI
jgi:hypothetical protein